MTKADFEKCIERTLNIYAFYHADDKKYSRQRTEKGYIITSQNEGFVKDFARISCGEFTRLDKGGKVFVEISNL